MDSSPVFYRTYASYLRQRYGVPTYRIGVDAGFSCPNREADRSGGCSYCDELGATAVYHREGEQHLAQKGSFQEHLDAPTGVGGMQARLESITSQVEQGKKFLKRRYKAKELLLYFQAYSNTFAPVKQLKTLYDHALGLEDFRELIISTRPDCINTRITELIASYKNRLSDVWVELGLQSPSNATLDRIDRGHTVEDFLKAYSMLKDAGIKVSVHLLLSLPGEGYAELDQASELIRSIHPDAVKIHNLHIPSGTRMYHEYLCGELTAASDRRHMMQIIHLLERIPSDIIIQRLTCDTPAHRLAAPRSFAPKGEFISNLRKEMVRKNAYQGRLT
jgi:hypothetical protein